MLAFIRYIPVPTGNAMYDPFIYFDEAVYPCTYRERNNITINHFTIFGISLYLQGTPLVMQSEMGKVRYIPVPTGNAPPASKDRPMTPVYPCTYRERYVLV